MHFFKIYLKITTKSKHIRQRELYYKYTLNLVQLLEHIYQC